MTSIAQMVEGSFAVVTYEMYKFPQKEMFTYYWITPTDSIIYEDKIKLYPLYTEFSNDNYCKCLKGDSINIFISTTETNYSFNEDNWSEISKFIPLVEKQRLLIQNAKYSWNLEVKYQEIVKVYITPVVGKFCTCIQKTEKIGGSETEFFAQVYLPVGAFEFDKVFWESKKGKLSRYFNFVKFDFSSHLALDYFDVTPTPISSVSEASK